MRADTRHTAAHVVGARFGQRGAEASLAPSRLVAQLDARHPLGKLLVGLADEGRQSGDQHGAGVTELIADLCQLRIPHVKRQRGLVAQPATELLQQHVALLHDAIQLQACSVVLQRQCHQHIVEEPAPPTRTLLHHRQIVGREHRDAHDAEQFAGTAELLAVHQHAVATVAAQLELDQDLAAVVVHDGSAHHRAVGPDADHCFQRCAAEAVEGGEIRHRLGEVGLALPIQADDRCRARLEIE